MACIQADLARNAWTAASPGAAIDRADVLNGKIDVIC
jgi:hypothetical protein